MSLHKEISFEDEICQHLAANGWLFAETGVLGNILQERRTALISAAVTGQIDVRSPTPHDHLVGTDDMIPTP